jgi:hypothetical protein
MKNKRTRIWALAVVLALCMAGEALWAQSSGLSAWQGENNADKKEWDEMRTWHNDMLNWLDRTYNMWGKPIPPADAKLYDMARALRFSKQTDGVEFWKKNKAAYQAALTTARQQFLARQEAEKAEAERKEQERGAAVFSYRLTDDSKGVVITGYKGDSGKVIIPAEIEGFPVVEIASGWQVGNAQKNITSLVIPDTVTRFPESTSENLYAPDFAFYGMSKLTEVTLPKGLKRIPNGMFGGCNALTSFTIPQGVTEIGRQAFAGSGLMSVTIPNTVTKIGGNAFAYCSKLTAITIPASVTEMGSGAFRNSGLESFTIPARFKKIGEGWFESCSNLTAITIPAGVTEIGFGAFYESGLQSITIPDTVSKIGARAFSYCKSLTTVTVSPVKGRVWEQELDVRMGEWYWDTFRGCESLNLRSQAALRAAGYEGGFD